MSGYQYKVVDAPQSNENSPYVRKPGRFHVIIMAQEANPAKPDNSGYVDGFEVTFGVVAGTEADQFDKSTSSVFFNPNEDQKDKGVFCARKIDRLMKAACLVGDTEAGQEVSVDLADLINKQVVIELCEKKNSPQAKNPNGTHIELAWDRIWHIDHPEVKDVPKNEDFLALIDPVYRRPDPSFFGVAASQNAQSSDHEGEGRKQRLSPAQLLAQAKASQQPKQSTDVSDV